MDKTPVYCFGVKPGFQFLSTDETAQFRFINYCGKLLRVTVEVMEAEMFYIAVYDEQEKFIGWIDSNLKLTEDKNERSGFSSKDTADSVRFELEEQHEEWYTELVTE